MAYEKWQEYLSYKYENTAKFYKLLTIPHNLSLNFFPDSEPDLLIIPDGWEPWDSPRGDSTHI